MITPEAAAAAVGLKVVYRAPHVQPGEPGEEGVITSVALLRGAFVRYGSDVGSRLTPFETLTLVSAAVERPDSVTHFLCHSLRAPAGATHHIVPHTFGPRCRYCGRSAQSIRKEMGLDD